MMPYCGDDPPPHCSAGQLHPQFYAETRIVEENLTSESSIKINPATPPLRRSWRWRIVALIAICTLLVLLTVESAFAEVSPVGDKSSVHHQGKKSEYGKKLRHEVVLRKPSNDSVKQSQFSKRGLRSRNKLVLQSALIQLNMNPQQVAKPPWSHKTQRVGTGLQSSKHRILVSSVCTNKDISIFQSPDGSSGIPRYAVQIMNNCMSDCPPSDIHVFCGWFASALLVNPNSFKRIAYNDCLVNGGKPLRHGETLRFTYANSFMYPLRFKSASFCK